MGDWRGEEYRAITVNEAEQSRAGLLDSLTMFADMILERYQRERNPTFTKSMYETMVRMVEQAAIVFWRSDLWVAASSGAELFVGKCVDVDKLRPRVQLWVPDLDLNLTHDNAKEFGLKYNRVLNSILLVGDLHERFPEDYPTKNNLATISFFYVAQPEMHALITGEHEFTAEREQEIRDTKIPLTDLVPTFRMSTFFDQPVNLTQEAALLSMIDFMHQPYVSLEKHLQSRQVRRAADRKNQKLPDVRHVVLRRAPGQRPGDEYHPAMRHIDWNCQWLVASHWRNQYYPSTGEHHPKFIQPYLKGPEDKPLKKPVSTIFSVER